METDSCPTREVSESAGEGLTCSRGNESAVSGTCSSFNTAVDKFFLVMGQMVNIFIFASYVVSVPAIQLCHWSMKAAMDNV